MKGNFYFKAFFDSFIIQISVMNLRTLFFTLKQKNKIGSRLGIQELYYLEFTRRFEAAFYK